MTEYFRYVHRVTSDCSIQLPTYNVVRNVRGQIVLNQDNERTKYNPANKCKKYYWSPKHLEISFKFSEGSEVLRNKCKLKEFLSEQEEMQRNLPNY